MNAGAGYIRSIIAGQVDLGSCQFVGLCRTLDGVSVPKTLTSSAEKKLAGISGVHTGP